MRNDLPQWREMRRDLLRFLKKGKRRRSHVNWEGGRDLLLPELESWQEVFESFTQDKAAVPTTYPPIFGHKRGYIDYYIRIAGRGSGYVSATDRVLRALALEHPRCWADLEALFWGASPHGETGYTLISLCHRAVPAGPGDDFPIKPQHWIAYVKTDTLPEEAEGWVEGGGWAADDPGPLF